MHRASLDLGSNSFKMLITHKEEILYDTAEVVGLGEGLKLDRSKCFSKHALQRAEQCFLRFRQILNEFPVQKIQAVATAAARKAKDPETLIRLGKSYGIAIEIISGEKEAELTYAGASLGITDKEYLVIDIGGASTEILYPGFKKSFSVGCVALMEDFGLQQQVGEETLLKTKDFLDEVFHELKPPENPIEVIAVAGTPTTLVCIEKKLDYFDAKAIHKFKLSKSRVQSFVRELNVPLENRKQIVGLDPKRANVMLAGSSILLYLLEKLNCNSCTVSVGGIRYALAKEVL